MISCLIGCVPIRGVESTATWAVRAGTQAPSEAKRRFVTNRFST